MPAGQLSRPQLSRPQLSHPQLSHPHRGSQTPKQLKNQDPKMPGGLPPRSETKSLAAIAPNEQSCDRQMETGLQGREPFVANVWMRPGLYGRENQKQVTLY